MQSRQLFHRFLASALLLSFLDACSSQPTVERMEGDSFNDADSGAPPGARDASDDPVADDPNVFIPGDKPDAGTEEPRCEDDGGCHYLLPADAGPACGDSILDEGEECDDGNSVPGDGCSGACSREPNFECDTPGERCVSTIVCGNGTLEGSEVCDDGNTEDGDGCSSDCASRDVGFDCAEVGMSCVDLVVCGDGVVTGDEACDDGEQPGGCNDDCTDVEEGWLCLRPGAACIVEPRCGDGQLTPGERCDDGNEDDDDGCSSSCEVEPSFICSEVGALCEEEICGDGLRTLGEQCDDGNGSDDDGCTDCELDDGWICPEAGSPCIPRCGDGLVLGSEQCDDGNLDSGDGCSLGCGREAGFECAEPGMACTETECPDGNKEGDEGCDDGNAIAGDGCGPTCQNEPSIEGGVVQLSCGDGLITGTEECDDGNSNSEDGCSDECKQEEGFECVELLELPESVEFAVTLRDFKARTANGGHPDFQTPQSGGDDGLGIPGEVCDTENQDDCGRLDADGKPVLAAGNYDTVQSADSFAMWFRDDADATDGVDIATIPSSLLLNQTAAGADVYIYDSADFDTDTTGGHFPLDGNPDGFDTTCGAEVNEACCTGRCAGHDYHFTTELRYFFQYRGGETLTFRGDDDVWVYINGRLAVDIGGVHCAQWGRVVLGDEDSSCSAHGFDGDDACEDAGTLAACTPTAAELSAGADARFGLTEGGVYEIVLFHAERRLEHSNFRLTLGGFLAPRSACLPVCGDGIVSPGEVCDDGEDNEDDTYNVCNTTCSGRPFCGDGQVSGPELCDNGFNISGYGDDPTDCAPGCMPPPICGDGSLQPQYEQCDDGEEENTGAYDGCTADCELGPYCGDGKVDEDDEEECDDGLSNGGYGKRCGFDCKPAPRCGDGIRNGPEQCDLGEEDNTGEYETCNPDCTLSPRCGDGQIQEDVEECDDGENDGGYGECAPGCQLGPRCGDGVVQPDDEDCDDGENDGGYGECAPGCRLGPRCGDGTVQEQAGEQCDDGNLKASDGCDPACRVEIPVQK